MQPTLDIASFQLQLNLLALEFWFWQYSTFSCSSFHQLQHSSISCSS